MILQRLKQETSGYHEQLERGLRICDEHLTLARYTSILVHFLGFYQPVELLLSPFQQRHILIFTVMGIIPVRCGEHSASFLSRISPMKKRKMPLSMLQTKHLYCFTNGCSEVQRYDCK